MEILSSGLTLELCPGAFPLSTDSMALAWFAKLKRNSRVLDLGSGCGTLGLLLCGKRPDCHVVGVERQQADHEAALENIRRNGLDTRMESICADLGTVPSRFPAGSFSACISNPPYFSGGFASSRYPQARQEETCTLSSLLDAAAWALQWGGDFYLVHKPERLGEILSLAGQRKLECKRLCLVRHREGGSINLILLALRKGGKPGMAWEEIALYDKTDHPTPVYREIYSITES